MARIDRSKLCQPITVTWVSGVIVDGVHLPMERDLNVIVSFNERSVEKVLRAVRAYPQVELCRLERSFFEPFTHFIERFKREEKSAKKKGKQLFVVTTSPFILNHVKPENILILKESLDGFNITGYQKPERSYGCTIEEIYQNIFELPSTRPNDVVDLENTIYREIEDRDFTRASVSINKLKSLTGSSPEIVRMNTLIRRYSSYEKNHQQ